MHFQHYFRTDLGINSSTTNIFKHCVNAGCQIIMAYCVVGPAHKHSVRIC